MKCGTAVARLEMSAFLLVACSARKRVLMFPSGPTPRSSPRRCHLIQVTHPPRPDWLRRPGRSSSRRLRCCRKVAPPLLHDRPLRLRPDGAPPAAATMTAAAAPAVGKKDLACCRRESPRADGARRGALSGGGVRHMLMQISPQGDLVRQVIWGLCWAASRGAPGRRTSGAKSKYSEIPPAFV